MTRVCPPHYTADLKFKLAYTCEWLALLRQKASLDAPDSEISTGAGEEAPGCCENC